MICENPWTYVGNCTMNGVVYRTVRIWHDSEDPIRVEVWASELDSVKMTMESVEGNMVLWDEERL